MIRLVGTILSVFLEKEKKKKFHVNFVIFSDVVATISDELRQHSIKKVNENKSIYTFHAGLLNM